MANPTEESYDNKGDVNSKVGGSERQPDAHGRRCEIEIHLNCKRCNMTFLDADVKRPLAHVGATVDEGNVVVCGQQDSYIQNMSTGQRIPMRRNGAFLVQLDAQ